MLFKEKGNKDFPTIILLHGGGLSDWSLMKVADQLSLKYHVVTTIIDGHGEDANSTFISIEESALKVIDYINQYEDGNVYAISGLSIGAQIVCELLSREPRITQYALIESALVYPIKGIVGLTAPIYQLGYGFLKKRWFAKMQAKTLCVPNALFESYFNDSLKISKESLINVTLSNGNYALKESIVNTKAKVMIVVGEKEIRIMRKSANLLHSTLKNSELFVAPKMKHGELSLVYSDIYIEKLNSLLAR